VTSAQRSAAFPDIPTLEDAGMKGQESETMQGFFLPGGAPKELVQFLNAEIAKVMAMPDVKAKCAQLGFDVVANSPDKFAEYIKAEVEKWARVIREAKIEQIK
jgi:tripartite-type tricarboxylate transporter receptor subunit TctC